MYVTAEAEVTAFALLPLFQGVLPQGSKRSINKVSWNPTVKETLNSILLICKVNVYFIYLYS